MALRETDPDFESEIFAEIKAFRNAKLDTFQYEIPLPVLLAGDAMSGENLLPCHEPAEQTIAVSAHVSARIHAVYKQMTAAFEGIEDPPARIGIRLDIRPQDFDPEPPWCYHRRYHSRRLQLHDPEKLPDLPSVRRLSINSRHYGGLTAVDTRPLSPLALLQCLVHLPNAEEWNAHWLWERPVPCFFPSRAMREHYARPWEGPLRDARHEFGAAVMDQEKHLCGKRIPASLTRAALHFWPVFQIPKYDESVARPNLIYPADKDPVSVGLCRLGAQLSLFDVRAVVTPDLFPSPEAPTDQQWSRMRRFRLEFHPLRPDGRWYFVGPDREDPHDSDQGGYKISDAEHYPRETDTDEDEAIDREYSNNPEDYWDYYINMFRVEPCRERIEPLLAAFAMSLTRDNMPSLEDAEAFANLWWHNDLEAEKYSMPMKHCHRWGVKFIAGRGGEKKKADGDASDVADAAPTLPVVQWQVGDWRPSEEVMSLFESLGRQEWLDLEWNRYRRFPEGLREPSDRPPI